MKKQKIIIADNNKCFRDGLKEILLNIGNVKIVAEVSNGFSLLNALENRPVDIVFTEVELPIVNGKELIRMGSVKYPDTKFVALSSLENERYVDEVLKAGADDYLFKSNDNYDFFRKIIGNIPNPKVFVGEMNKTYNTVENTLIN